ncbi:hypothetical protein [Virgibacillus ndiopensis]|uniref:hypothetical protein n=1 Tax=Virgibacillus ndiopensis TaxID=2004408 RepID=UPI000C06C52B|nr:hypothetical protein [Virgibacillus ndiopensis]
MRKTTFLVIIISFLLSFINGCSSEEEVGVAYISIDEDSGYRSTFKELNLGKVYDFEFKLMQADKSWVTIWVEGYRNGEKIKPIHLTNLSYGLSPNKVDDGHLGFGIINPQNKNPLFFLYAPGVNLQPHQIENDILDSKMAGTWNYAIGDEETKLELGKTRILGAYRQVEKSYKSSYDFDDPDAVKQMIKEDKTVLLLKIKVEEKE